MNEKPWLAHYDKGVPQTFDIPSVPLFHFLEESARKYPDRACTIFKGAVITYKEMNATSDRVAAALVELGMKKGDLQRLQLLHPAGGALLPADGQFHERGRHHRSLGALFAGAGGALPRWTGADQRGAVHLLCRRFRLFDR